MGFLTVTRREGETIRLTIDPGVDTEKLLALLLRDGITIHMHRGQHNGHKWVSSRLYPTRIEVVADDALIASHVRLLDRDQVSYDWQHYLPLIERKPGALRNGAPFADLPAPLRQLKHGLGRHAGGDRIMAQVLAAVPVAGLDAVLVAVELVLESGSLSAEHILNVVARLTASEPPPSVETHLSLKEAPVANTARYDRLRGQTKEIGHA